MIKRRFTLIELLFVITIFIILIGISWVAGAKVMRDTNKKKYNAECKMIESAIERYKDRWNVYPFTGTSSIVNFAEKLSDVAIDTDTNNPSPWTGALRAMYIDYDTQGFFTSNNSYRETESEDCPATTLYDPYEEAYQVEIINGYLRVFTDTDLLN